MIRRIAFLSDVHGNLTALKAVLRDLDRRGIEERYFLGDVLGKGPAVHEVVQLLREHCTGAVYGNWDRLVLKAFAGGYERFGAPYYVQRLTEDDRAYLSALPETAREEILFKRLLLKEGTVLNGARIRRGQLIQGFERALSDVNAVICPAVWDDGSASDMPAALSLIGMCGLTLPCGKTPEGQNLGLLIAARQFSEDTLLILGKIYEQANHMSREVVRRGRHCRIPH